MISCVPKHLPYATVKLASEALCHQWAADDIIVFNEDDQTVTISPEVQDDIEQYTRFVSDSMI